MQKAAMSKNFDIPERAMSKRFDRQEDLFVAVCKQKEEEEMEIGKKLKEARINAGMTQEKVSEEIQVSRQTISNWENEKSFPDIISVIKLSDLYTISLDQLLKGDVEMIKHLDESTNVVNSNKKLLLAIGLNGILLVLFIFFNGMIANNHYLMIGCAAIGVISTTTLFYQIIRKL